MPNDGEARVAVVGAAGFVGRELLRRLEALGIKAMAVVRGAPELSVDGEFHDACSQLADLAGQRFDVVVNLAYPAGGKRYEHPDMNRAITDIVKSLSREGGRIIQVSTLAVFGGALDRLVTAGPVPATRDVTYVEAKVLAEHEFSQMQTERGLSLDIVRLGNVWGHASGTWVLPIAHRLLTGRPVGVAGVRGYSNVTDVANVADYLAFLIQSDRRQPGVNYHHVAEFSSVAWDEWVVPVAEAMCVRPVYADATALPPSLSAIHEIAEVLAPVQPRHIYQQLADGRVTGSWSRSAVRRLPAPLRARLQSSGVVVAADPELTPAERDFLAIMGGQQEFRCAVDPGWTARLSKEESLAGVLQWLERE
jgi:nucleoside-diphosphate-sugar epimerase